MAISFDTVPSGNRVPATFVEVDPSRALARQPGDPQRVLLIGLRLAAGTQAAGTIVEVGGELAGEPLFGVGSQLGQMVRAFKRINPRARLYALAVDEAGGGAAATGTIALSGTSTRAGSLTARVGSERVTIALDTGTTAAAAATALAAALNASARLPYSAAAATGTVTLTARHKGLVGNDVTLETELVPQGLTVVDTQPAGGTTNPSLATTIAALDDTRYDTIVSGLTDAANLTLLEAELDRRWGPTVKLPGHLIVALRGSHATLVTAGNARNSPRSTVVGAGLSPSAPWVVAAQAAARDAQVNDTQPNRPRAGLVLDDVEAPKPGDRFDANERDALLHDGISTLKVGPDGKVLIERLITTYQVNAGGTADATYLSIETVRNLASTLLEFLSLGDRHQRDLLAPDGTNASPGVPMVTPAMVRGEILALYRSRERRGLVKDADGFAADLLVELDETDVERLNVQASPRLVGGLVTTAIKLSFQL